MKKLVPVYFLICAISGYAMDDASLGRQMRTSSTPVTVVYPNGAQSVSTLSELIAKKLVIVTVTPGPAVCLPTGWMETPIALGCTMQIEKLESFKRELLGKEVDADLYDINTFSSAVQKETMAAKKFSLVKMISDENNQLQREFGLKSFSLAGPYNPNDKSYLERFTIVFKPNGDARVFRLDIPVKDNIDAHIEALRNYIKY